MCRIGLLRNGGLPFLRSFFLAEVCLIKPTFLPHSLYLLSSTFVRILFTYSRINFRPKIAVVEGLFKLMTQNI